MNHTITQEDATKWWTNLEFTHVFCRTMGHVGMGKRLVLFCKPYLNKERFAVQTGRHLDSGEFHALTTTEWPSLYSAVEEYNKVP